MFLYNWREQLIYAASAFLSQLINSGRNPKKLKFETILLIKDDEIGDLCYSLPVFAMIRTQYPDAVITLLCKPFAKDLVLADPNLNSIITDWKMVDRKYDLLIDLRGTWKSNWFALKTLPNYRLDRGSVKLKNKFAKTKLHESEINFKIIESLLDNKEQSITPVLYQTLEDANQAEQFISSHYLKNFAVMHTSTRRELKKWPLDRFADACRYLKKNYGLDTVFIGDKNDVDDVERLQATIAFKTYSSAGVFSLGALGAMIKKANIYIGNDSGPLHIAALSGTPSIGLFGPVAPGIFYPPVPNAIVLHKVLPCNPCNQINCVHPENPCIQRISLEEVKDKIDLLLGQQVNSSVTAKTSVH